MGGSFQEEVVKVYHVVLSKQSYLFLGFSLVNFQIAQRINASGLSLGDENWILSENILEVICGFVFCAIACVLFLLIRFLVGKVGFRDREKSSVYECGFEPMGPTRVSFSLRFFLVAVIFLVFDLEVVLLFPYVLRWSLDWVLILRLWLFLLILAWGLAHEWNEGSLDWKE